MPNSTTIIQDIINRRVESGLADLLLTVFDAGYCAALGSPPELTAAPNTVDLLTMLTARHRAEVLASRGWLGLDCPIHSEELPSWLLRQRQQADPVRVLAAAERESALGDSLPPPKRS